MVILIQNEASLLRNAPLIPDIRKALLTGAMATLPPLHKFRPRTPFTPPIYASPTPALPSFHFLQWADIRDPQSGPGNAPSPEEPAHMHATAHPRILGAIGLLPLKLNDTLDKLGKTHTAASLTQLSRLLRSHTISTIKKWLVRKHTPFEEASAPGPVAP
jgi:hypothetical protein